MPSILTTCNDSLDLAGPSSCSRITDEPAASCFSRFAPRAIATYQHTSVLASRSVDRPGEASASCGRRGLPYAELGAAEGPWRPNTLRGRPSTGVLARNRTGRPVGVSLTANRYRRRRALPPTPQASAPGNHSLGCWCLSNTAFSCEAPSLALASSAATLCWAARRESSRSYSPAGEVFFPARSDWKWRSHRPRTSSSVRPKSYAGESIGCAR